MGAALFFRKRVAAELPQELSQEPLGWPVAGGPEVFPVYRDEWGHINSGQGPAWDLCNLEGIIATAVADCIVVVGTGNDPFKNDNQFHAGNVVVYQFGWQGETYRWHHCHLQGLEVSIGQQLAKGERLGLIGYTGTFFDDAGNMAPGTPAKAHSHVWCERWSGASWVRVWPSELYN